MLYRATGFAHFTTALHSLCSGDSDTLASDSCVSRQENDGPGPGKYFQSVIWSAAVRYLIYLVRESRYWVKRKLFNKMTTKVSRNSFAKLYED